ncbi:MAG: DUF1732 domain-containing protein [Bdellovibrionales bacterium]|nr:DUF1732 domain-containing protein [Bdellovibrionales bacterium]
MSAEKTTGKTALTSMTGYACIDGEIGGTKYRFHLKSVNHRYFEMKWRAPRNLQKFELEARAYIQERLVRGAVECSIETPNEESSEASQAQRLFHKMQEVLEASERGGLSRSVKALVLARFPDLWWTERKDTEVPDDALRPLWERVTADLLEARQEEGAKLTQILVAANEKLLHLLGSIETALPRIREKNEKATREKLAKLAEELHVPEVAEQRLLQEFLMTAERRDVAEEIARIRIHAEAARKLLRNPPPKSCGKKLEFILQELHREWTTLGNKIQDADLAETVIDAKLELDRMKEQSANVC